MNSLLVVYNALPSILSGSLVTVGNVTLSLTMGLLLGVPMAVAQVYGGPWLRRLVALYVWFFRGVPILVLLFLCYGLFISIGISIDPFFICCIVLGSTSTAYQSQIFRGAIESLPHGQLNAARALGMRESTGICSIILPQAMRLSIPGWANEFSILLKDSAICFVLGTQDIMARTSFVAARTHEHRALYATAGVLYVVLTPVGLKLLRLLEQKIHVPGYSSGIGMEGMGMG